jgi:hypothetical protein
MENSPLHVCRLQPARGELMPGRCFKEQELTARNRPVAMALLALGSVAGTPLAGFLVSRFPDSDCIYGG